MSFTWFILVLALAVALVRTRSRLAGVEQRLLALEGRLAGLGPADAARPAEASPAEPAAAPTEPITPAGPDVADAPPTTTPARPPRPRAGIEERLGTRWAVWVGGVALALGGLFTVRYSIEQNLLGPGARVTLGAAFAAALAGAGEWLRRRERPGTARRFASANVPAVLTAAGTSTAFAVVYAAYALYDLVGPGPAFVLLGLLAVVTMAAAALHGPALAALGLVGALAVPLLVSSDDPNPTTLVIYLAVVVGAADAVARLRLWRRLALAAAVGAIAWGVVLALADPGWTAAAMIHVLVQLAVALAFLVADPHRTDPADGPEIRVDGFAVAILCAFALLAGLVALSAGPGAARSAFACLTVTLLLLPAWAYPAVAGGAAAAALATVATLAGWPVLGEAAAEPVTVIADIATSPLPAAVEWFLGTALVLGSAIMATSFGSAARRPGLRLPVVAPYAAAATFGPLAILVTAYWRVTAFERSLGFAVAAAALALVFADVARRLDRSAEREREAIRLLAGAAAAAAIAALAIGLTFALERGYLTVSLSLAALGTAFVARRVAIPALRYATGALALGVAARLAYDPSVVGGDVGATPVLNWLLWGYGVPALAFWLSGRILREAGRDRVVDLVEALAILLAALWVALEIRHALHAGDPFAPAGGLLEAGLDVTEALGFSLLLTRAESRRPARLYRIASLAFGALALLGGAAALLVWENPFVTEEPVAGGAFFNALLPAYLLPAALAALLAAAARRSRPRPVVLAAAAFALALELAYACLEVRILFHGPGIGWRAWAGQGELWAYSLVLLANGLALLGWGLAKENRVGRIAGFGCLVATVLKVFVIDLANLEGLTRALSFVGLGAALVLVGLVYQRLVGRDATTAGAEAGD